MKKLINWVCRCRIHLKNLKQKIFLSCSNDDKCVRYNKGLIGSFACNFFVDSRMDLRWRKSRSLPNKRVSSLDINKEKSKMSTSATNVAPILRDGSAEANDLHGANIPKSKSIMRVTSKQGDPFTSSKSKVALNITPTVREETTVSKSTSKFLGAKSTSRLVQNLNRFSTKTSQAAVLKNKLSTLFFFSN